MSPSITPSRTVTMTPSSIGIYTQPLMVSFSGTSTVISRYDVTTNTITTLDVQSSGILPNQDIACTQNKFWLSNQGSGNIIKEYTYTASPFNYVLNRTLNIPVTLTDGLTVRTVGGIEYLIGCTGNTTIVEMDISSTTAIVTDKFDLPLNRTIGADMMYTNTGKLIVANYSGGNTTVGFMTQYNYETNTLEIDRALPTTYAAGGQKVYFVSNNNIYSTSISASLSVVYQWNTDSNINNPLPLQSFELPLLRGSAQPQEFININFTS